MTKKKIHITPGVYTILNDGSTSLKPPRSINTSSNTYSHEIPLDIHISTTTFSELCLPDTAIATLTEYSTTLRTHTRYYPNIVSRFELVDTINYVDNNNFKIIDNTLYLSTSVSYNEQSHYSICIKYTNQYGISYIKPVELTVTQAVVVGLFEFELNVTNNLTVSMQGILGDKEIDWGDGIIETVSSSEFSHSYATPNVYRVCMSGCSKDSDFSDCIFATSASEDMLTKIYNWGSLMIGVTTADYLCYYCTELTDLPINWFGWDDVISAKNTFSRCSSLITIPSTWAGLGSLSNAENMFSEASELLSIPSTWVALVNLTNASNMFYSCTQLGSIPDSWVGLENLNTSYSMFNACESLNSIPNSWVGLASLTTSDNMFSDCYMLTTIPNSWLGLEQVTSMGWMFYKTNINVIPMSWLPLSSVTYIAGIFDSSEVSGIPSTWDGLENITDSSYMFESTQVTSIPLSWQPLKNVTKSNGMFAYCTKLQSNNMPVNWVGLDSLTSMNSMFKGCTSLTYLPDWDGLLNVQYMLNTFSNCTSLVDIKASYFNVDYASTTVLPNIRYVYELFGGCSSITSDIYYMFCYFNYVRNVMNYSHKPYGSPSYGGCFRNCINAYNYNNLMYNILGGNIWCTSSYV